jgi:hypothetical protein
MAGLAVLPGFQAQCLVLGDNRFENLHDAIATPVGPNLYYVSIVEHHSTDPITRINYSPGRYCSRLCGGDGFHRSLTAKEHRQPLINHQQSRAIALFGVDPRKGFAGAGGDLPIDGADVVAGLIAAQFLKIQPPAPAAERHDDPPANC